MPRTLVALVAALGLISVGEGALKREQICRLSAYPSGQNINWTCPEQKTLYAERGLYTAKNILASRFQMSGSRAFILTPRFLCGVPFTLGVLSMVGPCKAEPILTPYPCWESHDPGNSGIINAVDIFIDRKKILWILDVGIIETLDKSTVLGPPKVIAICTHSSKVVATVDLSQFCTPDSRFHEIQVEVTEEDDTFIYVSDAGSKAIVVWDYSNDNGSKLQLPPEVMEDGSCRDILYLTLINNSYVYFSFMNGRKMFRTNTCNLKTLKPLTEVEDVGTKPGKLVILGSDRISKIYFRGKGNNQIYMWDINKPFKSCFFVCIDAPPQGMFTTQVALGFMKFVWALSSNFPDFAAGNKGSMGPFVKLHPIVSMRCRDRDSDAGNDTSNANGNGNGSSNGIPNNNGYGNGNGNGSKNGYGNSNGNGNGYGNSNGNGNGNSNGNGSKNGYGNSNGNGNGNSNGNGSKNGYGNSNGNGNGNSNGNGFGNSNGNGFGNSNGNGNSYGNGFGNSNGNGNENGSDNGNGNDNGNDDEGSGNTISDESGSGNGKSDGTRCPQCQENQEAIDDPAKGPGSPKCPGTPKCPGPPKSTPPPPPKCPPLPKCPPPPPKCPEPQKPPELPKCPEPQKPPEIPKCSGPPKCPPPKCPAPTKPEPSKCPTTTSTTKCPTTTSTMKCPGPPKCFTPPKCPEPSKCPPSQALPGLPICPGLMKCPGPPKCQGLMKTKNNHRKSLRLMHTGADYDQGLVSG